MPQLRTLSGPLAHQNGPFSDILTIRCLGCPGALASPVSKARLISGAGAQLKALFS